METISLDALLVRVEQAKERMSQSNPNRLLLLQCQEALVQLATRLSTSVESDAYATTKA